MKLTNGQLFPTMTASRVGGGEMVLPQDVVGHWAIILFYRGHWCPYCRQQLLGFQQAIEQLHALNAEVVALSVDTLEQAQQTVERHHLSFPVLYGIDAHEVAEKTGAFTNEDPHYIQATGFVLHPDGKILQAVYSTGAVGRFVAADIIGLLKYLQQQH
jgi:peroxiredoxin